MKKAILIIIVILVAAIIGGIVLFFTSKTNNKNLELVYEINAGIPFRWEHSIEDEKIVEFVNSKVIRNDNKGGIVGASVYTKYTFRGLKEGKTTITFKLVNFADNYTSREEIYTIKVDKEKKISIISKKGKDITN